MGYIACGCVIYALPEETILNIGSSCACYFLFEGSVLVFHELNKMTDLILLVLFLSVLHRFRWCSRHGAHDSPSAWWTFSLALGSQAYMYTYIY